MGAFIQYLNRPQIPPIPPRNDDDCSPPKQRPSILYRVGLPVIGVIGVIGLALILFTSNKNPTAPTPQVSTPPSRTSPKPSNLEATKITIGVLGKSDRYAELKKYLQQKFGDRVQIQLDGSEKPIIKLLRIKLQQRNGI